MGSLGALIPIIRFLLGSNIGRVVLIIGAVAYFMGFNPLALLEGGGAGTQRAALDSPQEKEKVAFVSAVLAQTEDVWSKVFKAGGAQYKEPSLVLFRDGVSSACGTASSQMGPFYCPADKKVYLDLSFFEELEAKYKAAGDFAQAYVIAHEVGHHVQNLLGTLGKINELKSRTKSPIEQKRLASQGRAAGRLLCGRLGALHGALQGARRRRHRGGAKCRERDRRRRATEKIPRPRDAGLVHARLVKAAHDVV